PWSPRRKFSATPYPAAITTMHPVVAGAAQADKVFQFKTLIPMLTDGPDVVDKIRSCQLLVFQTLLAKKAVTHQSSKTQPIPCLAFVELSRLFIPHMAVIILVSLCPPL